MDIKQISAGNNPPADLNVIIEIPANATPIKYEIDKDSGAVLVDRFMAAPMFYPANYGFVPHTIADDGDPLDVLVIAPYSLAPGCVIRSRPVAVLNMKDEAGGDAKIVAVPHSKLTPSYDHIQDLEQIPELLRQQIEHFFTYYKKLEPGKWVEIDNWQGLGSAHQIITSALK